MPITVDELPRLNVAELQNMARQVRVDVLKMTHTAGSGHPGGSLSETELLLALYFGGRLRVDPKNPKDPDRDRLILSKGHACPGLYAVLGERGFFPREELAGFRRVNKLLQGHTDIKIPGVDMSAGSLGMGISFGNGCALAARLDGRSYRTYVIIGDGECQEGNIWEAAMSSAHRKIDNLCVILDYNKIQIDGFVKDVKNLEPVSDKWRSFGWHVIEIDGHSFAEIFSALDEAAMIKGQPTIIIAHTIKGKGISFMENEAQFHGRALTDEEMERAMDELDEEWP
jgi:transketolase